MISDDLRRQADTFIELDELRSLLGRSDRKTPPESEDTAETAPFGLPRAI